MMRKAMMVLWIVSGTTLLAEGVSFIGIDGGQTAMDGKESAAGTSIKLSGLNTTSYTLKLGSYNEEKTARGTLFYQYVNRHSWVDEADMAGVSLDYIVPTGMMVKPFIGATAAYGRYKESGLKALDPTASKDSIDLSGFAYGGQAGLIVELGKNIELEGGYRYLYTSAADTLTISSESVKISADDIRHWYAGLNYKF